MVRNSEVTLDPDKVVHIPCADPFSVIVQLRDFSSHRLWNGGKLVFDGGYPRESISVAYLGDEIKCQHRVAYNSVRFVLPHASIKEFLYEEGQCASVESERIIGIDDPAVYHLALVLLPSFARAGGRNELFTEQVILALLIHVQDRLASIRVPVCIDKGLVPRQLRRTKELIAGHLAEGVSVAHLVEECGLSRSCFTKAFKCNTGVSPHKWLMCMRVNRIKELMLGSDEPLSQIDVACDFSDQLHFSRIFLRLTGALPSTWRRVRRQRTDVAL